MVVVLVEYDFLIDMFRNFDDVLRKCVWLLYVDVDGFGKVFEVV